MPKETKGPNLGMLLPESSIRPELSLETVKNLVERLYGISCLDVKELPGFDDRNFKIDEDPNIKNPLILNHSPDGYVMKITNSLDSQQLSFLESQCELMNYLSHHSIKCPKPYRNVYGHQFALEQLINKKHVIRLLDYQPGETLENVPKSDFLFYQVGEYVANIGNMLKTFSHTGLIGRNHAWMLDNVSNIEHVKGSVTDIELLALVEQVLKKFETTVKPAIPHLERGFIHGDINETNILVKLNSESGKKDDWRISSVLDFGDVSFSCYLFDLAIAMTYMIRLTGDITTGGYVLAGYSINRIMPQEEYDLLKTCIAARLCQTIVLSLHTLRKYPDNNYIANTVDKSIKALRKLWGESDEEIVKNWKKIATNYLTRSEK